MRSWFGPSLLVVATLTALRLAVLAALPLDLFVDEAQYWLWAQDLDFGYYSKPPLIAWVIRLAVTLGASDATFWVRASAPILHGATALILGVAAARLKGRRAAVWTVALYATLPFVSLGSLVISTDTVMAPFLAATLVLVLRTAVTHRALDGFAAGVALGMAFLAKYAALYFLPGLAAASVVAPGFRPGWRGLGWMTVGFLLVAMPNLAWNIANGMVTFGHTLDNAAWPRNGAALNGTVLVKFWAEQAALFGPITLLAMLAVTLGTRTQIERGLLAFVWIPLVVVSAQALLAHAYGNWAIPAYFGATLLVAVAARPIWFKAALALNLLVGIALSTLALAAPWPELNGRPVLARMLGRADLSRQILDLAQSQQLPILATDRDILADLRYTGAGSGVTIWAPRSEGQPQNYYEMAFPHPEEPGGPMLLVAAEPPICDGVALVPIASFDTSGGAHSRFRLSAFVLPPKCAHAIN